MLYFKMLNAEIIRPVVNNLANNNFYKIWYVQFYLQVNVLIFFFNKGEAI